MSVSNVRYAVVTNADSTEQVARYLPDNYEVYGHRFPDGPTGRIVVLIRGTDNAGWTMEDYVISRLASGLLWATEIVVHDDWRYEVANGDTVLGYSEWIEHQFEAGVW